jgi:sugar/nucleoside kinase (ribokinase family)
VFVGLCTLDVVHEVERLPSVNEKITAVTQAAVSGGPATNAAVTFAALGGRAMLVTVVGRGPLTEVVRADLAECGVRLSDVAAEHHDILPVSSVSVLTSTGERSVVSVDATLRARYDVPDLAPLLAAADVVVADGHHRTLAEAAARAVAEADVPLLVDAGRWKPAMDPLLTEADAVVCSADFRVPGATDPESSAAALLARHVPTVAVTDGAGPVRWWSAGRFGNVHPPAVEVADTAGAGDALHGAYAYAMAAVPSSSAERCLEFAVQVASLKCAFRGTRGWLPELSRRADTLRDQLQGPVTGPRPAVPAADPRSRRR